MYLLRDEDGTGQAGNPLGLPSGEFELPLVLRAHPLQGTCGTATRAVGP